MQTLFKGTSLLTVPPCKCPSLSPFKVCGSTREVRKKVVAGTIRSRQPSRHPRVHRAHAPPVPPHRYSGNISPSELRKKSKFKHLDITPSKQPKHIFSQRVSEDGSSGEVGSVYETDNNSDTYATIPVSGWYILEILIGRIAGCGLLGCSFIAILLRKSFLEQAVAFPGNALLVALLVLGGSLDVKPVDDGVQVRLIPFASLRAEKAAGRVAMLGMAVAAMWELLFFW